MKNKNLYKHKSIKLTAASLMSIIFFTLSAIPALAYNLPSTLESKNGTEFVTLVDTINVNDLSSENNPSPELISLIPVKTDINLLMENLDFSQSNYLCIDKNGNIFDGTIELQSISCSHNYESVQIIYHDKGSNGNCNTIHYNGKRCTKCNHIKILDKIANVTYKKCPH